MRPSGASSTEDSATRSGLAVLSVGGSAVLVPTDGREQRFPQERMSLDASPVPGAVEAATTPRLTHTA